MKLLCLPCAGASATMYFRWKMMTPDWLEIVPLELAGRGERIAEPHIESFSAQLDDISATYADKFTGDYMLFGHSMGGLLAYAMANKLTIDNTFSPKAVVISACPAPAARDTERYFKLDDASLIADLKSQNGTPAVVFEHKELLDMVISNLRADYKVCADYIHDENVVSTYPLHIMAGKKDNIKPLGVEAWQMLTTAQSSIDWFNGDHFYIQHNQCEADFLTTLVKRVDSYRHAA